MMKAQTLTLLAALLSLTSAAPTPIQSACPATVTKTCTVITTTITTTSTPQACLVPTTAVVTITKGVTTTTPSASAATAAAAGVNIQLFTGTLGGPPPPVISSSSNSKRPFAVKGDTFVGSGAALGRSCDQQHNACANAANSGALSGGVGQCDKQNNECHSFISSSVSARRYVSAARAALNLGSCSDTTILFKDGLDGRKEKAFIAANQQDFDHGSALKIGVIAGFVCQRLESRCKAVADATAACARASAAAMAATQDQAAADAFNGIMGGGAVELVQMSTAREEDLATTASAAVVGVETGVVVRTFTSCN
ncbi:hypothetical protein GE09DRAFT_479765 [Coniochaeta sp. 2T2.1]|nr:hypothetical protein GE09DRAFT_479765 [Coniochaeta sp. 2T2.1]